MCYTLWWGVKLAKECDSPKIDAKILFLTLCYGLFSLKTGEISFGLSDPYYQDIKVQVVAIFLSNLIHLVKRGEDKAGIPYSGDFP
jgi:hypothetical protein